MAAGTRPSRCARAIATAALATGCAAAAGAGATRPNIVFILADDLGWHDVGFSGSGIPTPHIDALLTGQGLGKPGARLVGLYGQPVCSPSRTAIHTGRYPFAYGLQSYVIDPAGVDYGLNLNETTLPQILSGAGYATWAVGKWHAGMARWEQTPTFRGYQYFKGYYSGGQDYFTHAESGGFDMHEDVGPRCGANCSRVAWELQGKYSAEIYSSTAVELISTHAAGPDAGQPFFMYLAFQSVHAPAEVPAAYVNASLFPGNPTRNTFAGMIRALDSAVGNVTAALQAAGVADNTIVVFVADNGGPITDPPAGGDSIGSSNWPLRGGKHSTFEGGVRLTGVVRGPGITAAGNVSALMHHTDWMPTLLEAAGVRYTPPPGFPLHGVSAWPVLTAGAPSARSEVPWIDPCAPSCYATPGAVLPGSAAIRSADGWKLHVGFTGPPWKWSGPEDVAVDADGSAVPSDFEEPLGGRALTAPANCVPGGWPLRNTTVQLYNVSADPWEREDVAAAHPDVVARLMARLDYWATQQVPPYWATATVDPLSPPAKRNGTWTPWLA